MPAELAIEARNAEEDGITNYGDDYDADAAELENPFPARAPGSPPAFLENARIGTAELQDLNDSYLSIASTTDPAILDASFHSQPPYHANARGSADATITLTPLPMLSAGSPHYTAAGMGEGTGGSSESPSVNSSARSSGSRKLLRDILEKRKGVGGSASTPTLPAVHRGGRISQPAAQLRPLADGGIGGIAGSRLRGEEAATAVSATTKPMVQQKNAHRLPAIVETQPKITPFNNVAKKGPNVRRPLPFIGASGSPLSQTSIPQPPSPQPQTAMASVSSLISPVSVRGKGGALGGSTSGAFGKAGFRGQERFAALRNAAIAKEETQRTLAITGSCVFARSSGQDGVGDAEAQSPTLSPVHKKRRKKSQPLRAMGGNDSGPQGDLSDTIRSTSFKTSGMRRSVEAQEGGEGGDAYGEQASTE